MSFAERMGRIKDSPTLAATARAKALAAKGVPIINFGPGEPDFDTPDHIKQACMEALRAGATKYGAVAGEMQLRVAICEKLRRENGLAYAPEEIVVTCGAKAAIYAVFQALVNPGDEVIIPAPYWVSYADQVLLCDGTPVIVATPETNGFKLTPETLDQAITPRTKLLVIGSPCNPTGSVYSRSELTALAIVCERRNILVLSDEIYEHLTYAPAAFASFGTAAPAHREQTILVNGVSKAYAMTGWRIGFAAGPKAVIQRMVTWQSQVVTHPTRFAQLGAVAAYTGPQDTVARMRAAFAERRDAIVAALRKIPGVTCVRPDGAFYVFPNIQAYLGRRWRDQTIGSSMQLADYLLDQAHIAVVAGEGFGQPGYLRFSYALAPADLTEGLNRFANALAQLET
ncbi:MAG: pyridoxal phosphate-dependent aminotransferase [Deltaproteobacteria bacterium]|nr:pyridoxal phosphate-dependent aminotransferase [Deltaproteobacteria bacterium]